MNSIEASKQDPRCLRGSGRPTAIARMVGEHYHAQIAGAVAALRSAIDRDVRSVRKFRRRINKLLSHASRDCGAALAEVEAIAQGARQEFDWVFALNAGWYRPADGDSCDQKNDRCTTIIVPAPGGGYIIGHTEDGAVAGAADLYAFKFTFEDDKPERQSCDLHGIGYSYCVIGCGLVVNSSGLGLLCNSLPDDPDALAVPRDLLTRQVSTCTSITEAIERFKDTPFVGGLACVLVQDNRAVLLEGCSYGVSVRELEPSESWVQTNHFQMPPFEIVLRSSDQSSRSRRNRAFELAPATRSTDAMRGALSDRQNHPDGICRERNLAVSIMQTNGLLVEYAWGPADRSEWHNLTSNLSFSSRARDRREGLSLDDASAARTLAPRL